MPSFATETRAAVDAAASLPLSRVMRRAPQTCSPATPVRAALETMRRLSIGSIIVSDEATRPVGILTLRDVVDRIVLEPGMLDAPMAAVMTQPPVSLALTDNAYQAALLMVRRGVRHVILVDAAGRVGGIVSERDLFGMQTTGVRHLSSEIKGATDLVAVERFGQEIHALARQMVLQGAAVGPLTAFISSLIDLLTERIVELELAALGEIGSGVCWIVMGSEGRSEQTLSSDQDNGIIFEPPAGESANDVRTRLLPVARRINEALDRAGYRLCSGNIMASNPAWCLTPEEWRNRFAHWIGSGGPEALLHGSIFFDLRALSGATGLAADLRAWLLPQAARNRRFLHQMAANALRNRPALGLLHRFATDGENRIDLKMNAATAFIDAARILSLGCALDEVRTEARLRAAGTPAGIPAHEVEAWIAAFYRIQGFRLSHQARCFDAGIAPDNRIAPDTLHDFDQQVLKLALEQARSLQSRLAMDYGL
ncbi:MAG: CBS domain-containing protein [Burkholderiales bacterium]|nr:CBS domain-containing protein [Burkholderiales bacterium]